MPDVNELDAEVLRALEAANHAWDRGFPTDPISVGLLRANLHSGDYVLVRRSEYESAQFQRAQD